MATKSISDRRKFRVRYKLKKNNKSKLPRLSIFKSNDNIHAQLINDSEGKTLASASSIDKEIRSQLKTGGNCHAAKEVGRLVAQRAKDCGITEVVFDRGSYKFHGRIKALADEAREQGLKF